VLIAGVIYAEEVQQLAEDLYKIDDITIKYKPPAGWAMKQGPVPSTHLNFRPKSDVLIMASLGIVTCSAPFASGFDMDKLMKATENDPSTLNSEMIDFADTKAFSSANRMAGLTTRTIQFLRDRVMFTITLVTESKDFESILPEIDESLKTFQVVSQFQGETDAAEEFPVPTITTIPAPMPMPEMIPVPLIAEPYREIGQLNSVVKVALKSGTVIKGKVVERQDSRMKVDFHGVPVSVYFNDIGTIDEIEPAVN
jgi:hypothetical protein